MKLHYWIIGALLVLSVIVVVVPGQASAYFPSFPTENTWISDGEGYATDAGNWENGTLIAGQKLWFTGDHNGVCLWNFYSYVTTWGWNENVFSEMNFVDNYTGHVLVYTYVYLYPGGPVPFNDEDPFVHFNEWTTYILIAGACAFMILSMSFARRRR